MNYITADESLELRLRGIAEPVDIRDANGKPLGHYTPYVSPELAASYEQAKQLFDPEELERRRQSTHPGYTFEQVMEHLRSLEKAENAVHGGMDAPGAG
jgi:hypothetical protein